MVSPSRISPSLKRSQYQQVIGQETFPLSRHVGPVSPQKSSHLESSSMVIKPKILSEASVLEAGIDDLGSPTSFVSPDF